MRNDMRIGVLTLFALFALGGVTAPSRAADYPTKLIKIVVPAAAGSALDVIGFTYTDEIQKQWGQTAILEHRPGANSMIGAALVAKAAPDGYTLLLTTVNHVINSGVHKNMTFDPIKDFTAVAIICRAPLVLVANPSFPAKTIDELIAVAKRESGRRNYSSPGIGSINHLAMEALKTATNIDIVHVPYGGSPQATIAVVSGEVPLYFSNLIGAAPQLRAGKLRAIAVTSAARSRALPDVPSIAESVRGYNLISWYGMLAPAGVPREIVEKLHDLFERVGKQEDFRRKLVSVGVEPASMSAAEFSTFMAADSDKWKRIAVDAKVEAE